jgi:hypothetical protein
MLVSFSGYPPVFEFLLNVPVDLRERYGFVGVGIFCVSPFPPARRVLLIGWRLVVCGLLRFSSLAKLEK